MVCWLSAKILSFISKSMQIESDMKSVYQYGFEITISSILNITLVLICSLAVRDIFAGIIYLFIFIFLRSFTGGYHATTYFRCNLALIVAFFITFAAYKIIACHMYPVYVCEVISLLNLIPIVIFSPVKNKHKPLDDLQIERSNKLSFIIASVLSVAGLVLYTMEIWIGAMIIMTITTVASLMIIEVIMQRRGYHES